MQPPGGNSANEIDLNGIQLASVAPEPGSVVLLLIGGAMLALAARRSGLFAGVRKSS
jgi:hypothetical protein